MTSDNSKLPASLSAHPANKRHLPIESGEAPVVPAFGCIVYFSCDRGIYQGRVANLAGIQVQASSQRDMLGQIVTRFKEAVAARLAQGGVPDWIDPPEPKRDSESKLFLPVHL